VLIVTHQVKGFQRRYKTGPEENRYWVDEWLAFQYEWSALEVLRMSPRHPAFQSDPNLFAWRRVIVDSAGRVAKELFSSAFPEEKMYAAEEHMSRVAVYTQYLQQNRLYDYGVGNWWLGRTRVSQGGAFRERQGGHERVSYHYYNHNYYNNYFLLISFY